MNFYNFARLFTFSLVIFAYETQHAIADCPKLERGTAEKAVQCIGNDMASQINGPPFNVYLSQQVAAGVAFAREVDKGNITIDEFNKINVIMAKAIEGIKEFDNQIIQNILSKKSNYGTYISPPPVDIPPPPAPPYPIHCSSTKIGMFVDTDCY